MKKVVFMNATLHELTEQQKEKIKPLVKELFDTLDDSIELEIVDLKNEFPDIYKKLSNIKYGDDTLGLAAELLEKIFDLSSTKYKDSVILLHLPVGSPKFMFEFSSILSMVIANTDFNIIPVFSHTERKVIEKKLEDGSIRKESVFKFNGYEIVVVGKNK